MLKQLSLTNFKSWKSIEKMDLSPITGLFGTNSSGKTSVLQLLLMLKQTAESPDRSQALFFGDTRSLVTLGSFQDILHGHDLELPLSWELQWNLPKPLAIYDPLDFIQPTSVTEMTFSAELKSETSRVFVRKMSYSCPDQKIEMNPIENSSDKYELDGTFNLKRIQGRPWPLPHPFKCYGFPDQIKAYYQNAEFLSDFQLAFEEFLGRVYYLGPLREYPRREYSWAGSDPADMGQRGQYAVDAILAARQRKATISTGYHKKRVSLEAYVAMWLQTLGLIHSFSIETIAEGSNLYRVWVQKSSTSAKVLITDVGFGVSQILPVLVLCFYVPKGSIILLEQPEIHLHPSVQAGLADVFIDAVKKRNVQIIFESHSEHLLQRLQRRIAEEKILSEQVKPYFCNIENGESKLIRLQLGLFGNIANWPKDFFGDRFGEVAATEEAALRRQERGE